MNNFIDIQSLVNVAVGLKELRQKVVFVGGAVINLYNDDLASEEIRPTEDIDMTLKLETYFEWTTIQERLSELEFFPDPFGHAICSYRFKGIPIDIMPAEESAIGDSNSWYAPGFKDLKTVIIGNNISIQILSAPYFLATKFEAFKNRGFNDYRSSHDFEDIIFVLDNRTSIVDEILQADEEVKNYLKKEFLFLKNHKNADEILSMHIHPLIVKERFTLLMEKINLIIE
ncbi:nucleotidyl transferase AbiEii/AbiGii toxin family protein [Flavobacterium eburneipallidum]|uniref:nucleotidyl transferase AbiEii/AbiGii toxin family protein n=1 Tax=Flavobacterium eburneipallidum TaxID=3003263 RepID=UPI0022AC0420|nr:nucleotidyl transferase AbiEii/AbiGii toxin family protein [Flavobacterium eburneipallidum]